MNIKPTHDSIDACFDEPDGHSAVDPHLFTVLPPDSKGAPCFACYFRAVYKAIPSELLDTLKDEPTPYPPATAEHLNRLSVVMAHLVDEMARMLVALFENPDAVMDVVLAQLPQALIAAQLEDDKA